MGGEPAFAVSNANLTTIGNTVVHLSILSISGLSTNLILTLMFNMCQVGPCLENISVAISVKQVKQSVALRAK